MDYELHRQAYYERNNFQRSRVIIFIISIIALLGITIKILQPLLGLHSDLINIFLVVDVFFLIILAIYWYLQILPINVSTLTSREKRYDAETQRLLENIDEIEKALSIYDENSSKMDEEKNSSLVEYIAKRDEVLYRIGFEDFDSRFLKSNTKRQLLKISLETLKTRLLEKEANVAEIEKSQSIEDSLKDKSLERMEKLVDTVTTRLRAEIAQQSKRADIYIIFGSGITLIAGVFLYFTVQDVLNIYKINDTKLGISTSDLFSIAVRFSIIIFIEVFAFYYLRLYKNIMDNIKYYQNEITNIEMKILSIHSIENSSCNKTLKIIASELARTERNFVIDKNKTTVDIERSKLDSDLLKSTTDNIVKLLKSTKK